MQDVLKILGANIKVFRKDLDWTQERLAEKSGISVPFMTQIELGKKSASLEVVSQIANALGVKLSELFSEDPPPTQNYKRSVPKMLRDFKKKVLLDLQESIELHSKETLENGISQFFEKGF